MRQGEDRFATTQLAGCDLGDGRRFCAREVRGWAIRYSTSSYFNLIKTSAVLEQRIGRAHRMGQKQPVQVYILVTEETIEESLLGTLSAKHDLALAALDAGSDVTQVDFNSGVEELRRRLEVLLGAKPEAPVDVTKRESVLQLSEEIEKRRDRVASAGGEMLGAVFYFLGELVSQNGATSPAEPLVSEVADRLAECVEEDASGRQRLTITLPDRNALNTLAKTLAQLMAVGESRTQTG